MQAGTLRLLFHHPRRHHEDSSFLAAAAHTGTPWPGDAETGGRSLSALGKNGFTGGTASWVITIRARPGQSSRRRLRTLLPHLVYLIFKRNQSFNETIE